VIAALEQRYPSHPSTPPTPSSGAGRWRWRNFFDEELGPYARHLAFYELINEPAMFAEVAAQSVPAPLARAKGLVGAYGRAFTSVRFGANSAAGAETARTKIVAALDRLDAELEANGGRYLVGDSFSVADLTAASLFLPGGGSRRGTGIAGLADAPRARALPRRPQRPRRLRLGRRDVPPPPPLLSGRRSECKPLAKSFLFGIIGAILAKRRLSLSPRSGALGLEPRRRRCRACR